MTRLIYYTACTLDGFLADPQDSLDWLLRQPLDEGGPNDYDQFIAGIGEVVMGSTTYEWILRNDTDGWGYAMPTWVMTSRHLPLPEGAESPDIRFASGPVRPVYERMAEAAAGKDLWVVGGGDLAGQFADEGLLDEIMTSIAPVTLGAGRPLLPRRFDLELIDVARNATFITARHRFVGPLREDTV